MDLEMVPESLQVEGDPEELPGTARRRGRALGTGAYSPHPQPALHTPAAQASASHKLQPPLMCSSPPPVSVATAPPHLSPVGDGVHFPQELTAWPHHCDQEMHHPPEAPPHPVLALPARVPSLGIKQMAP